MDNKIEELKFTDFFSLIEVPDGYGYKRVPDSNPCNIEVLINKINELVVKVNSITE